MALETNPYVAKVLESVKTFVAGEGTRPKIHTFVGLLGAEEDGADGRVRKLYAGPSLDDGIEILVADIKYYAQTPESTEDGLKRDVMFVRSDANVTHFSKRQPKSHGPRGGGGQDTGGGHI
jgi:hypothetical protein